ncbi:MAG: tripartite tricarboxylate transporter substrate binding protein [Pseudomonadota bacterium]
MAITSVSTTARNPKSLPPFPQTGLAANESRRLLLRLDDSMRRGEMHRVLTSIRDALLVASVSAALAAPALTAMAESYPVRPIRFIVPAPPGGAPDALGRIVGQKLGERFGQQVVVDNRGGGNGIIGSEIAARAAPDGYSIVMGYAGPFSINPSLYDKLPYDPIKDFVALTLVATGQNVLVAHPSFGARTVKDLIALAKSKPGQINYASGGTGQSSHLSMELLMSMAGIKMNHIPYKGAGPALADTLSGQVPIHFLAMPPAIPQVKAGKLIALAVSGAKRASSLPETPTIAEAGVAGYQVLTWYGALAPARTPQVIATRLHKEMAGILQSKEVEAQFDRLGLEAGGNSSADFAKFLRDEIVKWGRVIKTAGIKME